MNTEVIPKEESSGSACVYNAEDSPLFDDSSDPHRGESNLLSSCSPRKNEHRTHESRWEDAFQKLLEFRSRNGHANVPFRYEDDPHLGRWVSLQRSVYKNESHSNSIARVVRLNEIGFDWTPRDPRSVSWDVRYTELCEYVERNGDARVPLGWKENVQLANWVSAQRREFKLLRDGCPSRLTQDRLIALNKINFLWNLQTRDHPKRVKHSSADRTNDANEEESHHHYHHHHEHPSSTEKQQLPLLSTPAEHILMDSHTIEESSSSTVLDTPSCPSGVFAESPAALMSSTHPSILLHNNQLPFYLANNNGVMTDYASVEQQQQQQQQYHQALQLLAQLLSGNANLFPNHTATTTSVSHNGGIEHPSAAAALPSSSSQQQQQQYEVATATLVTALLSGQGGQVGNHPLGLLATSCVPPPNPPQPITQPQHQLNPLPLGTTTSTLMSPPHTSTATTALSLLASMGWMGSGTTLSTTTPSAPSLPTMIQHDDSSPSSSSSCPMTVTMTASAETAAAAVASEEQCTTVGMDVNNDNMGIKSVRRFDDGY